MHDAPQKRVTTVHHQRIHVLAPIRLPRTAAAMAAFVCLAACVPRQIIPDAGLAVGARAANVRFEIAISHASNGLRYAFVRDPRSNVVTVDVRYTVGAADDPTGKSGLAHLVEHLSFERAASPSSPTLSQRLDQVALSYNAYTNWDETHYMASGLTSTLGDLLAIEAERMMLPCDHITPEVFERERQVVLNELRERTHDDVFPGPGRHPGVPGCGQNLYPGAHADLCRLVLVDVLHRRQRRDRRRPHRYVRRWPQVDPLPPADGPELRGQSSPAGQR